MRSGSTVGTERFRWRYIDAVRGLKELYASSSGQQLSVPEVVYTTADAGYSGPVFLAQMQTYDGGDAARRRTSPRTSGAARRAARPVHTSTLPFFHMYITLHSPA